MKLKNKIISLLGFASKAGKLGYGFEATLSAIKARKTKLIIIAEDISEKSRKEIAYFADRQNVKHITLEGLNIKAVSDAVGRKCGIVSVNDSGFADGITAYIQGGIANDE